MRWPKGTERVVGNKVEPLPRIAVNRKQVGPVRLGNRNVGIASPLRALARKDLSWYFVLLNQG